MMHSSTIISQKEAKETSPRFHYHQPKGSKRNVPSAEFTAAAQRVWNGPEERLTANQVREGFSRIEISQYKTNTPYRIQI